VGEGRKNRGLAVAAFRIALGFVPGFALLVVFLAGQVLALRKLRLSEASFVELPAERLAWNPEVFKVLSLGQLPAVVDWLVLRFVTDPSYAHVRPGERAPTFHDLDAATRLDPFFFQLYVVGGTYLSVVRDDKEGAKRILERGEAFRQGGLAEYPPEKRARFWAAEWQLPLTLGYVYLFELEDVARGAAAFREASRLPGSPEYLRTLARRLDRPDGLYEIGIRHLDFQSRIPRAERERALILEKLRSLEVSRFVFLLNRKFSALLPSGGEANEVAARLAFKKLLASEGLASGRDPWGGELRLVTSESPRAGAEPGTLRVDTSTPRKRVLGLDSFGAGGDS
jgi:hypothetical protein